MFDGNERLVVCNRRYMQMYNLSADIVTPRSTLHSLLEYRCEKFEEPLLLRHQSVEPAQH